MIMNEKYLRNVWSTYLLPNYESRQMSVSTTGPADLDWSLINGSGCCNSGEAGFLFHLIIPIFIVPAFIVYLFIIFLFIILLQMRLSSVNPNYFINSIPF